MAPFFSGRLGVLIFFVISGFLITSLLNNEIERGEVSLPRFYARRFVRLAPAQLVFIAALYALTRLTGLHMSTCQFITALTYTKNYACGAWIDGHLWSLSVVGLFYLVWPAALVFLPRRWAIKFALFMLLLAPASRAIEYHLGSRNFTWLSSNADSLMIGCLAALFVQSPEATRLVMWRPAFGRLLAVLGAAIPVFLGAHLMWGAANVLFGQTLQSAAAAYLIWSLTLIRRGWSYAVLNSLPARVIGVLSYSLYLWQQPFFSQPSDFGSGASRLLTFPENVAAAACAATLSYGLVERPFLRIRRALARSPKRRLAGVQVSV